MTPWSRPSWNTSVLEYISVLVLYKGMERFLDGTSVLFFDF